MLPPNLLLLRHGIAEGNEGRKRSAQGDNRFFEQAVQERRHSSSFRLIQRGVAQSQRASNWVVGQFYGGGSIDASGFAACFTSPYARAVETAGYLGLPGARWADVMELSERDWGIQDLTTHAQKQELFREAMAWRRAIPFFWRPVNGESMVQVCGRLRQFKNEYLTLFPDGNVICVCHKEVILGFAVLFEGISAAEFQRRYSAEGNAAITYCEIVHYTRRDPETLTLAPTYRWVRNIRPTEDPVKVGPWREFERPLYTSEELLAQAAQIEPIIT